MVFTHKLTEKLDLYFLTTTGKTGIGNAKPVEVFYKTVFASITTQKGSSTFDTGIVSENYNDQVSFYCRYLPELGSPKKQFRIYWNGLKYKVVNLTHVTPRTATVIDCLNVS